MPNTQHSHYDTILVIVSYSNSEYLKNDYMYDLWLRLSFVPVSLHVFFCGEEWITVWGQTFITNIDSPHSTKLDLDSNAELNEKYFLLLLPPAYKISVQSLFFK